jgi:flagellum-specific peptidoglycan hydrolase FlgJ
MKTIKLLTLLSVLFYSAASNTKTEKKREIKQITSELNNIQVYAGRSDKAPIKTKYNINGLPNGRQWLSRKEWHGKHINGADTLERFKKWKQTHIKQFIKFFGQAAKEESKIYRKLKPSVIIAAAIIESNYGLSKLAKENNNIFGHKYRPHLHKNGFVIACDDSPRDKFGVYSSQWYSLRAHTKILLKNYGPRIKGKPTVKKWLTALCGGYTLKASKIHVKNGGFVYATSCYKGGECYAQKINKIIEYYDLKKYDS